MRNLVGGILVTIAAAFASSAPAGAQVAGIEPAPRVWEIPLGTPISDLPDNVYTEPACGTNGGPAGASLASFADFEQCQAEPGGLREIWFRFDDTLEYVALALRNPVEAQRHRATAIASQPAIFSLLVDPDGVIRGYRAFTDPGADPRLRYDAHLAAATLRSVYGTAWTCEDLPALEGETPIDSRFVKRDCSLERDDLTADSKARFFFKPGQQLLDPVTGKPMLNSFESAAAIEVLQRPPYAEPKAEEAQRPAPAPGEISPADAFLAGEVKNCPGCDLRGADLRRMDLTGADLSGADLSDAVLHRAILRGANLQGTKLDRAILTRADLTQADFTDASLVYALLFEAEATRTDFASADLSGARLGNLKLRLGSLKDAVAVKTDFGGAELNSVDFSGAQLEGSYFYQASLLRADLSDVSATGANFVEAKLRGADLSGANFKSSDFQAANLQEADLSDANFSATRLQYVEMLGSIQTGTDFTGALMPGGR